MKYENLYDDMDDYTALFDRSPKKTKTYSFNLIKTFQRGFSLSSFIYCVMQILRWFVV